MIKKTLLSLVALALAAFGAAYMFGYGGRVIGYLRVLAFPKDAGLLAYFPEDTHFAGFAQVPLARPPQSERLRKELERGQEELTRQWGIQAALDVDSVMASDSVLAARGRFDRERMRAALEKRGFRFEEHEGRWMAIGPGAALALDGAYLVGGMSARDVKSALDRKARGQGLAPDAALVQRVDAIGWRHPLFAAVDLEALAGGRSMPPLKSVGAWIDTPPAAIGLGARVAPQSPEEARKAASELEKAKQELARKAKQDPQWAEWAPVVEKTSVRLERDQVEVRTVVPEALLEKLLEAGESRQRLASNLLAEQFAAAGLAQAPSHASAPRVAAANSGDSDEAEASSDESEAADDQADAASTDDSDEADSKADAAETAANDAKPAAVSTPVATSAEADEIVTAPAVLTSRAPTPWAPLAWAAGFALLLRLTVARRNRPGMFSMLLAPTFAIPAVLATTGLVFLSWFSPPPAWSTWVSAASLPLPDVDQVFFGQSPMANPLFYSAILPFLLAPFGVRIKAARRALCGLGCGYAGTLACTAVLGAPSLAWLGSSYVAVPWLALNALVSLFIARAMLSAQSE